MQQPAVATEQDGPQHPKLRGRPWVPGQSGNPSGSRVSSRAIALYSEMAADFGELSAGNRALLMQAAKLFIRSEREKDGDIALRMSGEARRHLESVKRSTTSKRDSSEISLADYLRQGRQDEAEGSAEDVLATPAVPSAEDATTNDGTGAATAPKSKHRPMAMDAKMAGKPDRDLDEDIARVCRGEVI